MLFWWSQCDFLSHSRDEMQQWAMRNVTERLGRLSSMITWSDDIVEQAVPLWWSHHRLTQELKRVNFVWIGFNLPIRQYTAGGMLQVFFILPQENCVRFCKCTSADTSVWHVDRQLVQIKNWQSSELSGLTLDKSIYRNTCTWQQKTKTKWFPLLVLRNCLSMVLKRYTSTNCWKGQCMLFPLQN